MAITTQPWLDDLSEEWIVQPAPGTPTRQPVSPAATSASQSVSAKSRSRLPRMRQSSGSLSEIQVRTIARELRPPKQRSALAERSLSDINIAPTSSPNASHGAPDRSVSHSFSLASQGSVMYGTVAHNTVAKSPAKEAAPYDTPEWRRRLVKGEVGYGNQTDLFGPTGLENIFQRPAENALEDIVQPKRKLGLLKSLAAIPSSPPPWPTAAHSEAHDAPEPAVQEHDNQNLQPAYLHDEMAHEQEDSYSTHTSKPAEQIAPRTVSGQIEFENEAFSPVYLTTNLQVGHTLGPAQNFKSSELANRLRQIGSPPPNSVQPVQEETVVSQDREDSSFARLEDESLPEGLPAGTPDLANVGRFVELRRGGYSRDGSFRRRPLSPSPEKAISSSRAAVATVPTSADQAAPTDEMINPKTPRRKGQDSQFLSPERAKNSGSPLKLFDAHDTFTSNRLQRRLSQLEHKPENLASSGGKASEVGTNKAVRKATRLASVDELSIQDLGQGPTIGAQHSTSRRVGTFGQGQLNEYQFSGDFSADSSGDCDALDDSAPDEPPDESPDGSPSVDVAPPGSRQPFRFQLDGSPVSRNSSRDTKQGPSLVGNPVRNTSRPKFLPHRKASTSMAHKQEGVAPEYAQGKRGPTSPFKNSTPKRRRTIHSVDEEEDEEEDFSSDPGLGSAQSTQPGIQSVIGRKRKDARHNSFNNIANLETLSRRHILRPRNPTPSQRRREEIHAEIMEATEAFILSSPKLNTIREQLEPSVTSDTRSERARASLVANEVAAFSMNRQKAMRDESRKRSVTTQDFLDEAVKIMDFIRTKGRPTSGLGSLEETEAESDILEEPVSHPSSSLTFERPPSREGRLSAWKEPNKRDLSPNVMSHLRKYQEKESDNFLNSSINSLRFSRMRAPVIPEGESVVVEQNDIRITDNPNRHVKTENDDDERIGSQPRTSGTQQSTASSLGHTVATSASRRSDHVATLAPEAVAHLIPKELAGMSFDREKNMWVRQKSPSKEHRYEQEDHSGINESEEDPFGNIPDLTIDETNERGKPYLSVHPQPTAETILEDTERHGVQEDGRPVTREGRGIAFTDTSSAPSKVSNFGWSYPKTETRASSWSTQAPRNRSTQKTPHAHTTYAIPESDEDEDDIEHEIKYFEGRGSVPPSAQQAHVRDITVSVGKGQTKYPEPPTPQQFGQRQWEASNIRRISQQKPLQKNRQGAKTLPNARPTGISISHGGELALQNELPPRNYRMQLSMSISAPNLGRGEQDVLLAPPSSPAKGDLTFMLSDLPEFTLNQIDEMDLPDRVVVKHNGTQFSRALEDRYAQGTAELVKALQDAEPDEPYWEDLRQVNLHKKNLSTLHRLDELCYQLEELDVSDNQIHQLEGVPYAMRRLQAQNNRLSALTSWATLGNLQHLDISGNELDGLDALAELVHLRVLKVDNNKIRSLTGVLYLDGLMELSAGGNEIEMADFSQANLKSLTDLDLRNNRLLEVRNVHCLPQLQHLNLNDNEIEEFPLLDEPAKACRFLRSIRLCRNGAILLDVDRHFPKLESLYVDGNSLTQVSGLEHLRYLRTFSAREQMLSTDSDTEMCASNLVKNTEVRNLYLSLNPTRNLEISQHLLSLQRLELASMGLKELPDNFGQLTPNIRSINLNFNSIKDLRPLLNVKRLSELLLVGNKIERLRHNAMVLGKLGTLSKLDWRDNPLSLRFYTPASENRIMSLRQRLSDEQLTDRFVLPDGDAEADAQHLLRLDYETRIRRRVTEMMLANLCKNLRQLDGLPFDKARVLVKDDVWERLLMLGVIQRKQPDTSERNETT